MALLYSAPVNYSFRHQHQHQQSPPQAVVPVVIHGTTYYATPSAAAADPAYLSVAHSPRSVAPSFPHNNYSSSYINIPKSQNQSGYSPGNRNRRTRSKQNSRPPRTFNREPLNNTTNVALEKPYVSVPKPRMNTALYKTPAPNTMYESNNNPRNAAVNRVPVQPPNNAVTRFDQQGDTIMTDASVHALQAHIAENIVSLNAVLQSTKEEIPAPEPLASTFLRNFLGRPLPFNIHDTAEADYVAHLISVLSDPRSPAARLLLDWSPAFVLRLQQFVLVRSQGAAVEEIAKQAKERCAGYMNACKEGAYPAGGRAWLAARELKKPHPRLHKHVVLDQHRKKLNCIGSRELIDMLV